MLPVRAILQSADYFSSSLNGERATPSLPSGLSIPFVGRRFLVPDTWQKAGARIRQIRYKPQNLPKAPAFRMPNWDVVVSGTRQLFGSEAAMRSKQYVGIILMLAGLTGCAMCDNSHDSSYTAVGGKWQRDNPYSGRVGSAFDPAGMQVTDSYLSAEDGMPVEIWEEDDVEGDVEPLLEDTADELGEESELPQAEMLETDESEAAEAGVPGAASPSLPAPTPGESGWRSMPKDSSESAPQAEERDLLPPLEFAP